MSLIVKVEQGELRGIKNKSILTGNTFYSFLGIPYAEKPIRFQDPEMKKKWEGIYEANNDSAICIQKDPNLGIIGSEDCLYLNIHTPQIPSDIKVWKPVMVHIHGGGYYTGSGTQKDNAADFLIGHDVIIVTPNYRLHVLGFLNLGIPGCPGNAGLKDQSLALRWVKNNISKFGGDPENITIMGESAGGACTHHQTISPMSEGLFNKAITQSGSSICYWAIVRKPYDMGFEIGKKLGYQGDNKEELLNYLKQQDARKLLEKAIEMQSDIRARFPFWCTDIPFGPSVEAIRDGAFLPDLPEKLLKKATPLPIITGADSKDGMFIFLLSPKQNFETVLDENFELALTNNFIIDPACSLPDLAGKVKEHYFGSKKANLDAANEISSMFTDFFYYNLYEAVEKVVESHCPVYVFEFNYDGGRNAIKKEAETAIGREMEGACHSDESCYLYARKSGEEKRNYEDRDLKVINEITTLWTNFAKYDDPSTTELKWKRTTKSEPSFLRIDAESKMVNGPIYGERQQYLKELLRDCGKPSNKI